ncbi:MAG TPA: hypothetical protein VKP69_03790 [Isosphaeraceae bacterium]|nr:hypothetical protein [Isosphaeraceae bacterium]
MERPKGSEGFVKLAKRWVAGRSVAWPGRDRRQSDAIRSILIAFNTMSFEIQVT